MRKRKSQSNIVGGVLIGVAVLIVLLLVLVGVVMGLEHQGVLKTEFQGDRRAFRCCGWGKGRAGRAGRGGRTLNWADLKKLLKEGGFEFHETNTSSFIIFLVFVD